MARFESIHPSGGSAAPGGGALAGGAAANNAEEEAARLDALLENVPQLYFQRNFCLEDQATFDATGVAVAGFGEEPELEQRCQNAYTRGGYNLEPHSTIERKNGQTKERRHTYVCHAYQHTYIHVDSQTHNLCP
jgi:hypothetical protein